MTDNRLTADPDYVFGQIQALRSLILAVAGLTLDRDTFRERGLNGLENARAALVPSTVGDRALLAIEHTEQWLRTATGAG